MKRPCTQRRSRHIQSIGTHEQRLVETPDSGVSTGVIRFRQGMPASNNVNNETQSMASLQRTNIARQRAYNECLRPYNARLRS
ncbi:hypothetical protein [Prolixibacter bellariivorans]|uniref:hypothetical protein n=1 Tax=Prolixibacter bellariivorans TaxID=314319 RepID=UPI0011DD1490|nr:hypothetical protein [Prolixibacter bellariivorans]